jgi:hypothetical protein
MEYNGTHYGAMFSVFQGYVAQQADQRKNMEDALVSYLKSAEVTRFLVSDGNEPCLVEVIQNAHLNPPVLEKDGQLHFISTQGLHTAQGLKPLRCFTDAELLAVGAYVQQWYRYHYFGYHQPNPFPSAE